MQILKPMKTQQAAHVNWGQKDRAMTQHTQKIFAAGTGPGQDPAPPSTPEKSLKCFVQRHKKPESFLSLP